MKTIIYILLFFSYAGVLAQKPDTLTEAKRKYTTAEQVLGLSSKYTVLKCNLVLSVKGEVFMVFYAKDGSRWCLNSGSTDFGELWQRMMTGTSGASISMNDITVLKDGKELKWMPKTFVVP